MTVTDNMEALYRLYLPLPGPENCSCHLLAVDTYCQWVVLLVRTPCTALFAVHGSSHRKCSKTVLGGTWLIAKNAQLKHASLTKKHISGRWPFNGSCGNFKLQQNTRLATTVLMSRQKWARNSQSRSLGSQRRPSHTWWPVGPDETRSLTKHSRNST